MTLETNRFYWDSRMLRVVFLYSQDGDNIKARTSNGEATYSIQESIFLNPLPASPSSFASFLREEAQFVESELENQAKFS